MSRRNIIKTEIIKPERLFRRSSFKRGSRLVLDTGFFPIMVDGLNVVVVFEHI